MKFLHLSDLHIGKIVNHRSMIEEQKHVFGQVLTYIQQEKPNAIVVAGDIYDKSNPSVEAMGVWDDFLTEVASYKNIAIMVVAGNHDSPERLGHVSRLLSHNKIFLCRNLYKESNQNIENNSEIQKVTLVDEYGDVNFWLLPFIQPSFFRETITYDTMIKSIIDNANIDYTARNVLVSHQYYTKTYLTLERSQSERDPIGGIDAVDAGIIEGFDYVALGHLHRPQNVGVEHIRYCGSPVKYSASECNHSKSITLVELGAKLQQNQEKNLYCTVKLLPLIPIHDMREIKGPIEQLTNPEIYELANREDYLYITLTDEENIAFPMDRLRKVYPNIMDVSFENRINEIIPVAITREKIENLPYDELFIELFENRNPGRTLNPEQLKILRQLLHGED